MPLYFITGNKSKYEGVKYHIPSLLQLNIDLPEIQEIDAQMIITEKLSAAFAHHDGEFIVEDTSLYMDCLNGLPGPLIKWFLKTMGNSGLYEIADKYGIYQATAKTIIGYARNKNEIHFFEGEVKGTIVSPRGVSAFGWNDIFQPEGYSETYAEMSEDLKNVISMRSLATKKLKEFLN